MLTTIQKMVDYAHSNQLKNYITYQPQKLAQLEQLLKIPNSRRPKPAAAQQQHQPNYLE